ncbi:MAG: hypothetical protein EAZ42_11020 [Verrucomicrobia bacterium]|nr:MAG: hypothetical protein EAZ42_11020 [Verrucomicrobiota bacterium]
MIPRRAFHFLWVLFCLGASTVAHAGQNLLITSERLSDGRIVLKKSGKPFIIQGANFPSEKTMEAFVEAGGNAIRTYNREIERFMPAIKKHQLAVLLGLHLKRERQGFNYRDQVAVNAQFEEIRAKVRRYKHEPEVMMWAIGNEAELLAKDTEPLWREINRIAIMIREEDPTRPILTVMAGSTEKNVRDVIEFCPAIDLLGINSYGSAKEWPNKIKEYGWNKSYILTEFGSQGFWGGPFCAKITSWGAPIEATSTEKGELYLKTWQEAVIDQPQTSLGAFAFIWQHKQERTHTWFSMFTPEGERTAAVDALQLAWTGKPPALPAPRIDAFSCTREPAIFSVGEMLEIKLSWHCERPLTWHVEIREEQRDPSVGGDPERPSMIIDPVLWEKTDDGFQVQVPNLAGNYRVFLTLRTADGTAALANVPFQVR